MKQLLTTLVCILIISACGNSPEALTRESVLTQTATSTSVISSTSSPTITITPSHTPEPTASSTPEVLQLNITSREQLATIESLSDISEVSEEEFWKLVDAPARQEIVYSDTTIPVIFGAFDKESGSIAGEFDYNLFFQQAVIVELHPGVNYIVLMYRIVTQDSNGNNVVRHVNICLNPGPSSTDETVLWNIQHAGNDPGVSFGLVTHNDALFNNDPGMTDLLIGDNPIRKELQDGGGIIPANIGDVLVGKTSK